jgi:hypothetical protein
MTEEVNFPNPIELYNEYHPDTRFKPRVRIRTHDPHGLDSYIGGIPKDTSFLAITCARNWKSECWDELQEAYENEGYDTHLHKTSGTTKTRSGTMKHAKTQLYVW